MDLFAIETFHLDSSSIIANVLTNCVISKSGLHDVIVEWHTCIYYC